MALPQVWSATRQIYGGGPKCFNGFYILLDFHNCAQQDFIRALLACDERGSERREMREKLP